SALKGELPETTERVGVPDAERAKPRGVLACPRDEAEHVSACGNPGREDPPASQPCAESEHRNGRHRVYAKPWRAQDPDVPLLDGYGDGHHSFLAACASS